MGEALRHQDGGGTACHEDRLVGEATDQRVAPRFTLLIRAAKLITRSGEFLCVIRDASKSGISMRIFHPLPQSEGVILELQNGDRYGVEMVWQEEDRAGFRFNVAADVNRIIESPSRFAKRPVRLNLSAPAEIEVRGRSEYATFQDLSQQGAKLACSRSFAIDESVKLRAAGMREVFAKIRWRREGTCGLVFEETFQYGELARIAFELQRRD